MEETLDKGNTDSNYHFTSVINLLYGLGNDKNSSKLFYNSFYSSGNVLSI